MTPGVRRAALTVHLVGSLGWIGAAAAYLVLGIAAGVSPQPATVRAAWIGMELTGWYAVVPLGSLALVTGLVMAVGTPWGLVRHYWVLISLLLTGFAMAVLLLHMPGVTARAALARSADDGTVVQLGGDVLHPALGLVLLVVIAALNIYKPRGQTGWGRGRPRRAPRPTVRGAVRST